jgi:hypothetical protein
MDQMKRHRTIWTSSSPWIHAGRNRGIKEIVITLVIALYY